MSLFSQQAIILNPFITNGISHSYQLDQSMSNFRVVGWYFSFLFKELRALRRFFAPPPPYEAKIYKLFFTKLFLSVYQNNNQSVQVSDYFDFDRCYGYKNGRRNRLKMGN